MWTITEPWWRGKTFRFEDKLEAMHLAELYQRIYRKEIEVVKEDDGSEADSTAPGAEEAGDERATETNGELDVPSAAPVQAVVRRDSSARGKVVPQKKE